MGIGPVPAVRKLLARSRRDVGDLDLVELNEAFASQSLAVIRELGLDDEKVNVNGGAIALGHPLGMSGARLVVSLLHELRRRGGRYGLATLCVGVGQGQAAPVRARRALDQPGRADVDHALVLDRHEWRAEAHDHALDLREQLVGASSASPLRDLDLDLVRRLGRRGRPPAAR